MNIRLKQIPSAVAATAALLMLGVSVTPGQQAPGGPKGPSEFDAFYTLGP